MTVIQIRGGEQLFVVGVMPTRKGDRFRARRQRPDGPACVPATTAGVTSFTCRRSVGEAMAVRDFVFDPEIHRVEGDG